VSPPTAWAVKDGRFCASAWIRSGWPVRCSEAESSTWMGEALFSTLMPLERVPVTITAPTLGVRPVSAAAAAVVSSVSAVAAEAPNARVDSTAATPVLSVALCIVVIPILNKKRKCCVLRRWCYFFAATTSISTSQPGLLRPATCTTARAGRLGWLPPKYWV